MNVLNFFVSFCGLSFVSLVDNYRDIEDKFMTYFISKSLVKEMLSLEHEYMTWKALNTGCLGGGRNSILNQIYNLLTTVA